MTVFFFRYSILVEHRNTELTDLSLDFIPHLNPFIHEDKTNDWFGRIHIYSTEQLCKLDIVSLFVIVNLYYNCFLSPLRITPRKFDMVPACDPQSPARTTPDLGTHGNLTLSKRGTRTSFTFRKIRHEPCRCGENLFLVTEDCDTIVMKFNVAQLVESSGRL